MPISSSRSLSLPPPSLGSHFLSYYVKVSLRWPVIILLFPLKPPSRSANETSGCSDSPKDIIESTAVEKNRPQRPEACGESVRVAHPPRRNPDRALPKAGSRSETPLAESLALSRALIGQKATIKQAELINEPLLSEGWSHRVIDVAYPQSPEEMETARVIREAEK